MRIVLDTNVFVRDFMLNSSEFRTLFSELPRLGYSLHIPDLVFDELVNKFEEEIEKVASRTKRIGVTAWLIPDFGNELVSPEQAVSAYRNYLERKFREIRAEFVDYPSVTHRELVERALKRKRPFRGSDTGGYRDALLWEIVLQLAMDDDVYFVSNNTKDFSDESKQGLHPHLLNDIADRQLHVVLFTSLGNFIERDVYPGLEALNEIRQQLEEDTYEHLSLFALVEEQLPEYIGADELDPLELGLPSQLETPTLNYVENLHDLSDIEVRRLHSGELLISFAADATCEFNVFIYKSDYYGMENTDIFVWDDDWNRWYVAASIAKRVVLNLQLTFKPDTKTITSVNILSLDSQTG